MATRCLQHPTIINKMKKIHLIYTFILLLCATSLSAQNRTASLEGHITDATDGQSLFGVRIYFPSLKLSAVTNAKGDYRLEHLPAVRTQIEVSFEGHQTIVEQINLTSGAHRDFKLLERDARLGEAVVTGVTGQTRLQKLSTPVTLLSNEQLRGISSTNIIDALSHEPGISQITTGSGISKPVIRGLGYNRIVVVNDGIRQEGQQWGDEHGIEIDPNSVHSAEVLKGPASLMYGSDALAGVVIFHEAPTLAEGDMRGEFSSEYQSNNGLLNYSLNFAGNKKGFVWNGRFSDKYAHDYKNKYDGYVYGTGFQERAFSTMFGLNRNWGYSHLTFERYHIMPDIAEGERAADGSFLRPDEKKATHDDFLSYRHGLPYQHVYHTKLVSDNFFLLPKGALNLILGLQQNQRKEYEEVKHPNEPDLYLFLQTLNYDARYTLPEFSGWKVVTGINGMLQREKNKGEEFLIPNYRLFDFGLFATTSRDFGRLSLNGGIRIDRRHINSDELIDGGVQRFQALRKNFFGVSGSVGVTYKASEQFLLRANVARGFRAPTISELSANGVHEGSLRYEQGNSSLKPETSWQLDMGADFSSPIVSAQLSLFANLIIKNYIYTVRQLDALGKPLIKDDHEVYQHQSGDARLMGGELMVDIHPIEQLHISNTFSYVNSVQLHQPRESKYLPFTPAPRWNFDVRYDFIRDGRLFNNTYAAIGGELDLRQNHFYAEGGTETATPSYTLVNFSAGTDLRINGRKLGTLIFSVQNLFDRAYQPHLSRLKYADINPVTGRRGIFNMGRSFNIKLNIPIIF